jgi:hypothetical protein
MLTFENVCQATVCMSTIPFDDGVTYNVSVEVVEPQGHVLRAASVFFTAAESRCDSINSPQYSAVHIVQGH